MSVNRKSFAARAVPQFAAPDIRPAAMSSPLVANVFILNRLPWNVFLPRPLPPVMPVERLFCIGTVKPVEPILRLLLVVSLLCEVRVQNRWT
jgi:hypothetical protein